MRKRHIRPPLLGVGPGFAAVALLLAAPPAPVTTVSAAEPPTIAGAPDVGAMSTSAAALVGEHDYVEAEFFISGYAQSYRQRGNWGTDGVWAAAPGETAPYAIRMLARYPADPARFNGVVVVEWLNVSGQTEADPDFTSLHLELFRGGYAYVGVGAQRVGVYGQSGLKAQNPERYAGLVHPGDSFSYDIYTQAGRAVQAPSELAPLGRLTGRIRRLIAIGESQSAGRMVTYVNAVHPLAQVYDAFLIHSRSGGAAPLAQDAENRPTVRAPTPARIRADLGAPVFQVQAEGDVPRFVAARQPDTDRLRTWELAGTAHADRYLLTGGGRRPLTFTCADPDPTLSVPINDGPMTYSLRVALRHLRGWAADGDRPPGASPFALDGDDLARDPTTGLVVGGVRTPHVDVPVRTLHGVRAPAGGGGFCRLFGRADPWNGNADPWDGHPADPSPTPEPVLSDLYSGRDAYLAAFAAAIDRGVEAGFLLEEDRAGMLAEAEAVAWPSPDAR